jgi:hypothetical protein
MSVAKARFACPSSQATISDEKLQIETPKFFHEWMATLISSTP